MQEYEDSAFWIEMQSHSKQEGDEDGTADVDWRFNAKES